MTPMLRQYLSIKEKLKDAILFFRLGDFYEMFFEDALKASAILDITLTSRDGGSAGKVPMCGVPYHAAKGYINRLTREGFKVAICEQTEDPQAAKGIVRREVVRIITALNRPQAGMPQGPTGGEPTVRCKSEAPILTICSSNSRRDTIYYLQTA